MKDTKYCPRCKMDKPVSAFGKGRYRKRTNDYGLSGYCKECNNERRRLYKAANYEKVVAMSLIHKRNWNKNNKDKLAAAHKKYFSTEKGKQKNREAQARFRQRQKEKMKNEKPITEN